MFHNSNKPGIHSWGNHSKVHSELNIFSSFFLFSFCDMTSHCSLFSVYLSGYHYRILSVVRVILNSQ